MGGWHFREGDEREKRLLVRWYRMWLTPDTQTSVAGVQCLCEYDEEKPGSVVLSHTGSAQCQPKQFGWALLCYRTKQTKISETQINAA